jgi:dethiobiotin synthetase
MKAPAVERSDEMNRIIVAGIGTEVGKTVVAAILTTYLQGEYWKPIQCGAEEDSDTVMMKKLIDSTIYRIHESAYSLQTPVSPHHAARLENISICLENIIPPQTTRPLIIESVGGIFVPLTANILSFDLFKSWNIPWILVSSHYLGSINHTLLTLDALKRNNISIAGLVFNGDPNHDSESAILEFSQVPALGRLLPEPTIDSTTIQKYAKLWQPHLSQIL